MKLSKHSTVIRRKLNVNVDHDAGDIDYRGEVDKVVSFIDFFSPFVLQWTMAKGRELLPGMEGLVEAARWYPRGGRESLEHAALKHYVAEHPELVGLPSGPCPGDTEYRLSSGDRLDVSFMSETIWVAAEVKSAMSPPEDITRGILQCIKYVAVMNAMLVAKSRPPNARAVLVLEDRIPASISDLKDRLGAEVIDRVNPRVG